MIKEDKGPHTRHDAFSKRAFELMLSDLGEVHTQHLVEADPQYADVWFVPKNGERRDVLGLLGQSVRSRCMLEIYRSTPSTDDLRAELEKGLTKSRRSSPSRGKAIRLMTWVISPGCPRTALADLGFKSDIELVASGIYQMPRGACLGLIVVNELPVTAETLVFRIFGRDKHQALALKQLLRERTAIPF